MAKDLNKIMELKAMSDSRLTELGRWMAEQEAPRGNLLFIPMKLFDIELYSEGVGNQLLLRYFSGRFQICPRKIYGSSVKNFLGLNYTNIFSWAILKREKNIRQTNPLLQHSYDFYSRYCPELF